MIRRMDIDVSILAGLRTRPYHAALQPTERPLLIPVPSPDRAILGPGQLYHPMVQALAPPDCTLQKARLVPAAMIQFGCDFVIGAAAVGCAITCLGLGQVDLAKAYVEEHVIQVVLFGLGLIHAATLGACIGFWSHVLN